MIIWDMPAVMPTLNDLVSFCQKRLEYIPAVESVETNLLLF